MLLLLLLGSDLKATAYKISRLGPKGNSVPKVDGYACIPVPKDKLVAPGQRASMHIYDASSIEVVRHAQAHSNSTYGQVVIDDAAMKDRRFGLLEVGSRIKLLSVTPSVHRDKFGGSSPSFKAEVIGVGLLEPAAVLQKMPFMTVRPADEECSLLCARRCEKRHGEASRARGFGRGYARAPASHGPARPLLQIAERHPEPSSAPLRPGHRLRARPLRAVASAASPHEPAASACIPRRSAGSGVAAPGPGAAAALAPRSRPARALFVLATLPLSHFVDLPVRFDGLLCSPRWVASALYRVRRAAVGALYRVRRAAVDAHGSYATFPSLPQWPIHLSRAAARGAS